MNTPAPPVDPGSGDGSAVERLGIRAEHLVQEFGYDADVDDDFRYAVEDVCGSELEDEDWTGGADVALLWWREGDGDLTDALVDLVGVLADGGFVVLLTPKPGLAGEVDPSEVDEAAVTAGLHSSGTFSPAPGWRATRLVAPRSGPRR